MIPDMSRKTCNKISREELIALQTGELSKPRAWAQQVRLQMHIAKCAACSAEWSFLQQIAATARELRTAEVPQGLMARNRTEVVKPAEPMQRRRAPIRPILAVCGLGLAFSAGTALWPEAARWADRNALPKVSQADQAAYQRLLSEPMPKPNRWDAYRAADDAAVTAERATRWPQETDTDQRLAAEAAVAANGEAYRLLASARGEACRIPLASLSRNGKRSRTAVGSLGHALAYRATAQRLKEDYAAGAETGLQMVRLGYDVAGAGDSVTLSNGVGQASGGLRAMAAVLPKLSARESRDLAGRLEARLRQGIDLDRVLLTTVYVKADMVGEFRIAIEGEGLPANQWLMNADRNTALFADYVARLRAEMRKPYQQRNRRISLGPADWLIDQPSVPGALREAVKLEAQARCMAAALRIHAFTVATGKAPRNLKQAGVTGKLSADPFTGDPLRYVVDKSAVLLYSVGEDGRDNRGSQSDDVGLCPREHQAAASTLGTTPVDVPYMRPKTG